MSSIGLIIRKQLQQRAADRDIGTTVAVTIPQNAPYSPSAQNTNTPLTDSIRAIIAPYSSNTYEDEHVNGTSILTGDKKLIIPYDENREWTPSVVCEFVAHNENWRAVNCDTLRAGDTVIGYKLQIRK